jgi:hypothetical protein
VDIPTKTVVLLFVTMKADFIHVVIKCPSDPIFKIMMYEQLQEIKIYESDP